MQRTNFKNQTQRFVMIMLVTLIALGGATSCKSKKKIAREQAAAEYASKVAQARKDLNAILMDETTWTLTEKENRLATIRSWNLQDEEILELLDLAEDKIARERAEAERRAEEERLREQEARERAETSRFVTLENQFKALAASPDSYTANERIALMLNQFASPDVPVLIIISQAGGFNDYDRPTTIEKYLNYVKDQKVFNNKVEDARYDANKKITELQLIKK